MYSEKSLKEYSAMDFWKILREKPSAKDKSQFINSFPNTVLVRFAEDDRFKFWTILNELPEDNKCQFINSYTNLQLSAFVDLSIHIEFFKHHRPSFEWSSSLALADAETKDEPAPAPAAGP